jgi:hypothetical protein
MKDEGDQAGKQCNQYCYEQNPKCFPPRRVFLLRVIRHQNTAITTQRTVCVLPTKPNVSP